MIASTDHCERQMKSYRCPSLHLNVKGLPDHRSNTTRLFVKSTSSHADETKWRRQRPVLAFPCIFGGYQIPPLLRTSSPSQVTKSVPGRPWSCIYRTPGNDSACSSAPRRRVTRSASLYSSCGPRSLSRMSRTRLILRRRFLMASSFAVGVMACA